MTKHLLRDLDHLKHQLQRLGAMVETAILKATKALLERRVEPAREVQAGDDPIDELEVQIEEECLKILALHQPVAIDLRFLVAVLKVNNDLERMGDLAVNIASRVEAILASPAVALPPQFLTMIEAVRRMVHDALQSLLATDVATARRVMAADEVVDQAHRQMFADMQAMAAAAPAQLPVAISLLSVSRYLERIADQSTNIAEDVVFLVEGEIVRHRRLR